MPLRSGPGGDVSARESLLGSDGGAGGVGAAQLHEELGGQLADVSLHLLVVSKFYEPLDDA